MGFKCIDVYFKPCELCHFQTAAYEETKGLCPEKFPSPGVILHL